MLTLSICHIRLITKSTYGWYVLSTCNNKYPIYCVYFLSIWFECSMYVGYFLCVLQNLHLNGKVVELWLV